MVVAAAVEHTEATRIRIGRNVGEREHGNRIVPVLVCSSIPRKLVERVPRAPPEEVQPVVSTIMEHRPSPEIRIRWGTDNGNVGNRVEAEPVYGGSGNPRGLVYRTHVGYFPGLKG